MAIATASVAQPLAASFHEQGRLQEARRNAERAEQEARALSASARAAQRVADRARENARGLKVQSDRATDDAGRAWQGVEALRGSAEARAEVGQRVGRVVETLRERGDFIDPPSNIKPVLAETESRIAPGSVIDVRA